MPEALTFGDLKAQAHTVGNSHSEVFFVSNLAVLIDMHHRHAKSRYSTNPLSDYSNEDINKSLDLHAKHLQDKAYPEMEETECTE